jgi:hypothetical protein
MARNRGPESFLKRQREQRKRLKAQEKIARRRERSALKREGGIKPDATSPSESVDEANPVEPAEQE